MMRKQYNKLVRDRIPEIIHQNGLACEVVTMETEEYRQALRQKLIEEAQEAAEASQENLVTEIADLLEVIKAVTAAYGIEPDSIVAEQEKRREERGGFEKQLKLLWTECKV